MERRDSQSVATFFWGDAVATGAEVTLADDALRHAIVRRLAPGDAVRVVSGRGAVATGHVVSGSRTRVVVGIDRISELPRPTALDVLVPIADRDHMLWAAEKCVEHQATSWRPVWYARSRSVASRGEGAKFADKVMARMRSALEQCGGAWMPDVHPEAEMAAAMDAIASTHERVMLAGDGAPMAALALTGAVAIAVGPEGGFEPEEVERAQATGWRLASLGTSVLRFETAMISAAAVIRAAQLAHRSP